MKQRQTAQNQYHSKQSPSKLTSAPPTCAIQTILHLYTHNSPQSITNKHQIANKSQERNFLSPNIELSHSQPNKMVFHHYQKFNTFQFQFDRIFQQSAKNIEISNSLNIYHSLLKQGKDVAVMAMGTQQSGLQPLIQGKSSEQNEGLYFTLVSQLWHSIKEHEKTDGLYSIKIILRFLVVSDEKIFDLLAPKNEVQLKDNGYKFAISGCSTYEIKSLYEFYQKLMQVNEQKRLLYSQSIMIVQAELAISKEGHFISNENVTRRYFTFVQWQKSSFLSSTVKSKENNNQSLLTFNMCIYELYKISCHNPQKLLQSQVKKLWSSFRNSHITMLIKHSFMRNSRVIFLACVSLKESQEQDSFQVLMVAKNLAKIDLSKFISYQESLKFKSSKKKLSSKKMRTQPVQPQSFEGFQNAQLSRIKENLKRILKQKEESDQLKEKQDEIIELMKQQKRKKRQLQNIRYRRQEIKVRQDISKLSILNSQSNSRVIAIKQFSKMVNLPSLHLKKASRQLTEQELKKLEKQQVKAIKQIDRIHQKIMENVESESNTKLAKNVLEMEIKLHEKDIVEFVTNKNKILNLLKKQVYQIKSVEREKYDKKVSLKSSTEKRKIKSRMQSPFLTIDTKEQEIHEDPQKPIEKEEEEKPHKDIFQLQNLKKMNKNNYLFEKRRKILKAKVSKGREQVNQFYEDAAKKFQQYRSK